MNAKASAINKLPKKYLKLLMLEKNKELLQ